MPDTDVSPQKLLDYNQAFASSLQALQNVVAQQRSQIASLVVDLLQQLMKLSQEAENIDSVQAAIGHLKQAVEEGMKSAAANAPVSPDLATSGSEDWLANMIRLLGIAQANTVAAQQQSYLIGNAALTAGLETLLSVVTAVLTAKLSKAGTS